MLLKAEFKHLGLRCFFHLCSEQGGASLNAEQYISVKLKLEIRGKITADLDNI